VDASAEAAARALSLRMFRATIATQEMFAAYLGVKLGLYQALHSDGPLTADGLAGRAGLAPRYAREWLEQQAVCGLITVDDPELHWQKRRYRLPAGYHRVLTASADPLSLVSTAVLPLGGVAGALPALLAAYRTGEGLPAEVFGDDWRDGHGGANRPFYTHQLAGWLRLHLPDAHRKLAAPHARVADLGCGSGWATVALAGAYPHARITAVDLDPAAVAQTKERVAAAGAADRVDCRVADLSTLDGTGEYHLVCVFDAVHELARPVEALRVCRRLCAPGGTVLVLEAQVPDAFHGHGDEIERFQYATSVLHCLPAALAGQDAVGTGTVLRAAAMRQYAGEAGFGEVRGYDLGDRLHRFYRLDPVSNPRD
jgi:SAM-dependent methyltransferase